MEKEQNQAINNDGKNSAAGILMRHQEATYWELPDLNAEPLASPPRVLPSDLANHPLGLIAGVIASHSQASTAMALNAVLSSYSLAIGGLVQAIHPKTKSRVPLSLYCLTIASTGERKSTVDYWANKPISDYSKARQLDYEKANNAQKQALMIYNKEQDKITNNKHLSMPDKERELTALGLPPKPIRSPQRIVKGIGSAQGLRKALTQHQPALGLLLAEGALLLGGQAMNSDNGDATQGLFCNLWTDGNDEHGLKDGASQLNGVVLAVHVQIQPSAWGKLAGGKLFDLTESGLIPRCLVCAPDSLAGTRGFKSDDDLTELEQGKIDQNPTYQNYNASLDHWLSQPLPYNDTDTGLNITRTIECDDDAKRIYMQTVNHFETKVKNKELNGLLGWCSRAPEHWLRLAAILTLVENPQAGFINEANALLAFELLEFYTVEQQRLQDRSGEDLPRTQAAEFYNKLLRACKNWKRAHGEFSLDCATQKVRGAKSANQARRYCMMLTKAGALFQSDGTVMINGKPKRETWRFNPNFDGDF